MQEETTVMRKGNSQHGIGRQRRMEKKNKILGAERSANIDTLNIKKIPEEQQGRFTMILRCFFTSHVTVLK